MNFAAETDAGCVLLLTRSKGDVRTRQSRALLRYAVVAISCPVAVCAQAAAPVWVVAPKPTTVIGVSTGDAALELAGVTTAHRLADGSVVLANSNPLELRLYTATGKFVRRIGHDGEGPGEFRDRVLVFGWAGDSLLTFTSGNARWAVFTSGGELRREWSKVDRTSPSDLLLYQNAFTMRRVNAPFACTRAMVDRLPATTDPVRVVFPDAAGRFWVRGSGAPDWIVYTLAGRTLGRVRLPADAELLEAKNGFVVVKLRDADDIERIEVWRVAIPAPPARASDPCTQVADSSLGFLGLPSTISLAKVARIKTELRNMRTAGDALHQRSNAYPRSIADLHYALANDLEARMLLTTPNGWGAEITDRKTGAYCGMIVGERTVPGWPSGGVACAPIAR